MHTLRTAAAATLIGGAYVDFDFGVDIEVDYDVIRGHAATWHEPGCGDTVTVKAARIAGKDNSWLAQHIEGDDEWIAEILQDWRDAEDHARDQRADMQREERWLEGLRS